MNVNVIKVYMKNLSPTYNISFIGKIIIIIFNAADIQNTVINSNQGVDIHIATSKYMNQKSKTNKVKKYIQRTKTAGNCCTEMTQRWM